MENLKELVKRFEFCMLITENDEGKLHGRPMAMQRSDFDGELWFMTSADTCKVAELQSHTRVNVSLMNAAKNDFVSLTGEAEIREDKSKIEDLWSPFYMAWFPEGKEDPKIRLIRVKVTSAEYWDAPSSRMVLLYQMAKQAVTGQPADMGENEAVSLDRGYVS